MRCGQRVHAYEEQMQRDSVPHTHQQPHDSVLVHRQVAPSPGNPFPNPNADRSLPVMWPLPRLCI